jgi:hypothetical protein
MDNNTQDKLYTQQEVDDLLKSKVDVQTPEKQEEINDIAVAKLVKKSNRILVSLSAVWPFDFFPDVINVEEGRVAVVKRYMLSTQVHSVDIKDISNIFINKSIFFSQLEIVSRTFEDNEVRIKFLRNDEAIYIRRIIEGLRVFTAKQIDTSGFTTEELLKKLEELSTTEIVT